MGDVPESARHRRIGKTCMDLHLYGKTGSSVPRGPGRWQGWGLAAWTIVVAISE